MKHRGFQAIGMTLVLSSSSVRLVIHNASSRACESRWTTFCILRTCIYIICFYGYLDPIAACVFLVCLCRKEKSGRMCVGAHP